jgi:drug/metabolite transporter (DMT)-like permease
MGELMPFLIVAAPLMALAWFLHRRSSHRGKHPLWPAFSAAAGAVMFLFAGAVGYKLNAADANAAGTPWSGTVIWWEVAAGIALLPVTAYCWNKGLRSLEPDSAGKIRLAR